MSTPPSIRVRLKITADGDFEVTKMLNMLSKTTAFGWPVVISEGSTLEITFDVDTDKVAPDA